MQAYPQPIRGQVTNPVSPDAFPHSPDVIAKDKLHPSTVKGIIINYNGTAPK